MESVEVIVEKDQKYLWHPFSLQKAVPEENIPIVRGEGAYLISGNGRKIFDGISSWWVNLHGHCHPAISKKVSEQIQKLDHVLFAGFTHEGAVELSEKLLELIGSPYSKIFYSDNGSTAVEVALKMAIQYWAHRQTPRSKILAFKGGYHGDTFGAMSVAERGPFNQPFWPFLFKNENVIFVDPPILGSGKAELALQEFSRILEESHQELVAFIFEPLVQGTAGMVMQEKMVLNEMVKMCREKGVLTIADEVMTGFGRTGTLFAIEQILEKPDLICLAKGITGGVLPLGATLCSSHLYEQFVSEDKLKIFFHGHSYTANSIAVAAALASLEILQSEECQKQRQFINDFHLLFQKEILLEERWREKLIDVRVMGTILALELKIPDESTGYFHSLRDFLYDFFLQRDLLLRPLGNIVYLMPPYCTDHQALEKTYLCMKELLDYVHNH